MSKRNMEWPDQSWNSRKLHELLYWKIQRYRSSHATMHSVWRWEILHRDCQCERFHVYQLREREILDEGWCQSQNRLPGMSDGQILGFCWSFTARGMRKMFVRVGAISDWHVLLVSFSVITGFCCTIHHMCSILFWTHSPLHQFVSVPVCLALQENMVI